MKYLKTYNENLKSNSEIIDDIKSIFQELEDDGLSISTNGVNMIGIRKFYNSNSVKFFITDQIIECVLRLVDFFKMNQYHINRVGIAYDNPRGVDSKIPFINKSGFYLNEISKVDFEIYSILIRYSKNN